MRFIIFKGETSVNDLATRIFSIQGPGSEAALSRAAATLVKANPQLADISKVPAGSLVAVPDDAPAISPNEQATTMSSLTPQTVQKAFDGLQQRLTFIETAAMNRLKSAMDVIQTTDVKAAVQNLSSQSSELVNLLPNVDNIAKDSEDALKDLQSMPGLRKESLTQLQSALTPLGQR